LAEFKKHAKAVGLMFINISERERGWQICFCRFRRSCSGERTDKILAESVGKAMSNGEDAITSWFARQRKLSARNFPIGIGDDMAQYRVGKTSVFITTDILLEDSHFDLRKAH